MSEEEGKPFPVVTSWLTRNRSTGLFRSWRQRGLQHPGGVFVPSEEPVEDTAKATQKQLQEMAEGLGYFGHLKEGAP
jgi:hypothetical protein